MKIKTLAKLSTLAAVVWQPNLGFAFNEEAIDMKIELRSNYRDSEDLAIAAPFPPNTFMRTVDPGKHYEISNFTLFTKFQFTEHLQLFAKLDAVDKYERNPTSNDKTVDIDVLLLRYGTKHTQGLLPDSATFYGQFGKFGKFERQEDRHLESYGLVSTAFNRLEDSGFEFGVDFSNGLYAKVAYTTGAPLFFRDPNALAGDNGVEFGPDAAIAEYNSGFVTLYDAEVEGLDLEANPESSLGLGFRWVSESGVTRINTLLHYNERDMADTIALEGTGYGGDIDLLQIQPEELAPGTITSMVGFELDGIKKTEAGVTLWLYHENFALFGQYVAQDIAGLERDGYEVEMSYMFSDLPLFESITPAIRYSKLSPDYQAVGPYPASSVTWDWDKYDIGANFKVNQYVSVMIEHSENEFLTAVKKEHYGETLVTLVLSYRM